MQFEIGTSTRRYFPPRGTAGLARSLVSGKRRAPLAAAEDYGQDIVDPEIFNVLSLSHNFLNYLTDFKVPPETTPGGWRFKRCLQGKLALLPTRGSALSYPSTPTFAATHPIKNPPAPQDIGCWPNVSQKMGKTPAIKEDGRQRAVIEHVSPEIDSGRFPAKRTTGEEVLVEADKALATLAKHDAADYYIRTATLSSAYNCPATLAVVLLKDSHFVESGSGADLIEDLARVVGGRNRREEIRSVLSWVFGGKRSEFQQVMVIGLSAGLQNCGAQPSSWVSYLEPVESERLQRLTLDAIQTLNAKNIAADEIKRSLQVLANTSAETAMTPVLELLDRFPPAPIQVAAIQTVSQLNRPG